MATQVITTRAPPPVTPRIMSGLESAVARMYEESRQPATISENTTKCRVHGRKKTQKVIRGSAMALRVP